MAGQTSKFYSPTVNQIKSAAKDTSVHHTPILQMFTQKITNALNVDNQKREKCELPKFKKRLIEAPLQDLFSSILID